MIRFDKVSKRYPNGHAALHELSFDLAHGEMVFLTGHSGAGKTTLLKLISLIERPSQGRIFFDNQNITRFPAHNIPELRRQIGIVFQNPHLLFSHTVFDNVALPLVIAGLRHQEIKKRVRAALDKVGLLNKEKLSPQDLSGGEQQRVGIARAVVNRPPLLIADEPTGNLDPDLSRDIMHLFGYFNQVGVSVLIATHAIALIAQFKHRVLKLENGHLTHEAVHGDASIFA